MKCPICPGEIELNTVITCRRCWFLIPANERSGLAALYRQAKDPAINMEKTIGPKLARCIRIVHKRHPELIPAAA